MTLYKRHVTAWYDGGSGLVIVSYINSNNNYYLHICNSLRKHAYSNILKILLPENENFQIKNSNIFHISAQNIDRGYSLEPPRRGGSNESHNLWF